MIAFLAVLVLLAVAAAVLTVAAVRTDGYGTRRDRSDRFVPTRPI